MEKQDEQERIQITQAVMGLLDEWSLNTKEMQANF